jgi:hypothetical protein
MVEGDGVASAAADLIELSRDVDTISTVKVEIVKEVETKTQWVYKDGVYFLDFTPNPPNKPTNWEIHEHKGKVFEYNPENLGLYSLGDLELKEEVTISDCIKRLKKWKLNPMPANTSDFISKARPKPVVPKGFEGAYVYLLGTVFKANSELVRYMCYVGHKDEWIVKHDPVTKKLGPCSKIVCY